MGLLDSLLVAGQELLQNGTNAAGNAMGIPEQGQPGRQETLSGLSKGALAGGALALLLGTKTGRNIGGSALEMGSMAALAGVAYKAYQNWSSSNNNPTQQTTPQATSQTIAPSVGLNFEAFNNANAQAVAVATPQNDRAILKAVIAGAKADGHIAPDQQQMIQQYIQKIDATPELIQFLQAEIAKPLNISDFAEYANNPELASQIYLASAMVANSNHHIDAAEQKFLDSLAETLNLDADFVAHLNTQLTQ